MLRVFSVLRSAAFLAAFLALAGMSASVAQERRVLRPQDLITLGLVDEARALFEQSDPSPVDRLFFEGRILKAQGRYAEAIETFREVLRQDPTYINARRELAHTLLLDEQYDVAEFHFRELLEIDPTPRLRDSYRRFLTVIDRNQPFGVSARFALLPSTNINRGTYNEFIGDFVIDNQEESGIGAQIGVSGYYRWRIGAFQRVTLKGTADFSKYPNREFDVATGEVAVQWQWARDRTAVRVEPFLRYVWRDDDADYQSAGGRFSLDRRLTDRLTIGVSLLHEVREFRERENEDGRFSAASLVLGYQIRPDLGVSLGGTYSLNDTRLDALTYRGLTGFGAVSKRWTGGFDTRLGAEYGRRDYDGQITGVARDDTYWRITGSVLNSRINVQGFTPRIDCSYLQNRSNLVFYDYNVAECQIALTRNF